MGDNATIELVMKLVATQLYDNSKYSSFPPLNEKENRTVQIQMEIAIYMYLMELSAQEILRLYNSHEIMASTLKTFQKLHRFLYNDFYLFRAQSTQICDVLEEMPHNTRYIKRVKTFLYPHSFQNRNVSLAILNGIMNMKQTDTFKGKIYQNIQQTNIHSSFEKIDETYRQMGRHRHITLQSTTAELAQNIKSLEKMRQDTHLYEKELKKQIHYMEELLQYKQEEIKNNYLKEYYKRTLLLNTRQCVDSVNTDVLRHIREFVGEAFLEKTRQRMIQKRYFKNRSAKQFLRDRLKEFSQPQLKEICRNNLPTCYDFSKFMYDEELYNQPDIPTHFLDTISPLYIGMYSTHILKCTKKEKIINKILQNVKLINDFEFQKEIILLNKIGGHRSASLR